MPREVDDYGKITAATEVAFRALMDQAKKSGLRPLPVMGLMYLPDQAVTRQWQEACRAALAILGVSCNEG